MPEELQPFFSVVIPSYNRSAFLPNTLTSILTQNYPDYEIIVVDDGSTDDTAAVIRNFSITEKRIRYFYISNSERGAARNFGLKKAVGSFVFFLDSDDIMRQNHLSVLKHYIDKYPEQNFFATKFSFLRGGREFLSPVSKLKEGAYDYSLFLKGNCLGTLICARRSNQGLIPFLEDRRYSVMEDWIFNIQNSLKDTIYIIDERTIHINDHAGRSMSDNKFVIKKRVLATDFLLNSGWFNDSECLTIKKYSSYFCSIHSYLAKDRKQALDFLLGAWRYGMFNVNLLKLSLKVLLLFNYKK